MDLGPDGYIYTTNTQNFLIKVYNPDGTYNRAIFYPFKKKSFDSEKFINTYTEHKKMQEILRNTEFPNNWPALTDMFVDDEQRIWVATYAGDSKNYRWYVLDEEGQHFAAFNWQAHDFYRRPDTRGSIRTVKNGYMYVFQETTDKENSSSGNFVRYKIVFSSRAK